MDTLQVTGTSSTDVNWRVLHGKKQFYALQQVSRSQDSSKELSHFVLFFTYKLQETGYFWGKIREISELCREAGRRGKKNVSLTTKPGDLAGLTSTMLMKTLTKEIRLAMIN